MPSLRVALAQGLIAMALVVACLAAATQWAAAMLGYQPALGAPWIDLLGLKVYAPWKLFVWWLAFDAQAPDVFARAGAVAALGGSCQRRSSPSGEPPGGPAIGSQTTTYGSARWADASDVQDGRSVGEQGVVLGLYGGRYLRHDGPEHVLAVAPTRSGKGVGLVLPTLLTWPGSAVIHDIKGENWELTAGWRAQVLALPAVRPDQPRVGPLQSAAGGAQGAARGARRAEHRRHPGRSGRGHASGATTGRRPRTRC